MVIAITGYKHSGKTTVAKMIYYLLNTNHRLPIEDISLSSFLDYDSNYAHYSTLFNIADPCKRLASATFDVPLEDYYNQDGKDKFVGDNSITVRDTIKHVAESTIEFTLDKAFWAKKTANSIQKSQSTLVHIIGDLRKPEENNYFKEVFDSYEVVKITSPVIEKDSGLSEMNTNLIESNIVVVNDKTSLSVLFNNVKEVVSWLKLSMMR